MNIALVQNAPRLHAVQENLDTVERMIDGHEADLFVLPELFASGYLFDSREQLAGFAEELGHGLVQDTLQRWAKEHDAAFCAGLVEREGDAIYNSAVVIAPEGRLTHYRKLHLFYNEKKIFDPGNLVPPVTEWRGARLGVMICFDWRFPETARSLAIDGADVILHPSNLVMNLCPAAMVTRAIENGVFIFTANRSGRDELGDTVLQFHCGSQAVDPQGKVLGTIDEDEEGVLVVEIDPTRARNKLATETNDLLADRRTKFYHLGE